MALIFGSLSLLLLYTIGSMQCYLFDIPEDGQVKAVTEHNFLHEYRRQLANGLIKKYEVTAEECTDNDVSCPHYAAFPSDPCTTNSWMIKNCKLSCELCDPVTETGENKQFNDNCVMKFVNVGNTRVMEPEDDCTSHPSVNTFLETLYVTPQLIKYGDVVTFTKMKENTATSEYQIEGKFKKDTTLFWQVKADELDFKLTDSSNTNELRAKIEITGNTKIDTANINIKCEKAAFDSTYYIKNFDSTTGSTAVMNILNGIETGVGASSFTGANSYMQAEALGQATWTSFQGFGSYTLEDDKKFTFILQSNHQQMLPNTNFGDMYFIIDGQANLVAETNERELAKGSNFAFVGVFIGASLKATWDEVTTKESSLIDFQRVMLDKNWCLFVSSGDFNIPQYSEMFQIINQCEESTSFVEATTFRVKSAVSSCQRNDAPIKTPKKTILLVGSLDQSGVRWDFTESDIVSIEILEQCTGYTLPSWIPKEQTIATLQDFYIRVSQSNNYVGAQVKLNIFKSEEPTNPAETTQPEEILESEDPKPLSIFSFATLRYEKVGSFVSVRFDLSIEVGDKTFLAAVVHNLEEGWVFSVSIPAISFSSLLSDFNLPIPVFPLPIVSTSLLQRSISDTYLRLQFAPSSTTLRVRGGITTEAFGVVNIECIYVHGNGVALGFKAVLSFDKIIESFFGFQINQPWLQPFITRLCISYFDKEVTLKFHDSELNEVGALGEQFALKFHIEWNPSGVEGSDCQNNGVCKFLKKYVSRGASIVFKGGYESASRKLSLTRIVSTDITIIQDKLILSSVEVGFTVTLPAASEVTPPSEIEVAHFDKTEKVSDSSSFEVEIKIGCTIKYTRSDATKSDLVFIGSFSASSEGEIVLDFQMIGIVIEPLGIPSFAIKDIQFIGAYNFVEPGGLTIGLGGTLVFGDVANINVDNVGCPTNWICFDVDLGLNPAIPSKSYLYFNTTSNLTIGNIAKTFGLTAPSIVAKYGFPTGLELSYATEKITGLRNNRVIDQGFMFKGSFVLFAFSGSADIKLDADTLKVNISLDKINWLWGNIKITNFDDTAGPQLYVNIDKEGTFEGDISGALELFSVKLSSIEIKFNSQKLSIKYSNFLFDCHFTFSLGDMKPSSGEVIVEQERRAFVENFERKQREKLQSLQQFNVELLRRLRDDNRGNSVTFGDLKASFDLILSTVNNFIPEYRDEDEDWEVDMRCWFNCYNDCSEISITNQNTICFEEQPQEDCANVCEQVSRVRMKWDTGYYNSDYVKRRTIVKNVVTLQAHAKIVVNSLTAIIDVTNQWYAAQQEVTRTRDGKLGTSLAVNVRTEKIVGRGTIGAFKKVIINPQGDSGDSQPQFDLEVDDTNLGIQSYEIDLCDVPGVGDQLTNTAFDSAAQKKQIPSETDLDSLSNAMDMEALATKNSLEELSSTEQNNVENALGDFTTRYPDLMKNAQDHAKNLADTKYQLSQDRLQRYNSLNGRTIALKTHHNKYIRSWDTGVIDTCAEQQSTWEEFEVEVLGDFKIALKSYLGYYLASDSAFNVDALRDKRGFESSFTIGFIYENNPNVISLKSYYDKYLAANDKVLYSGGDDVSSWGHFTYEIVSAGSNVQRSNNLNGKVISLKSNSDLYVRSSESGETGEGAKSGTLSQEFEVEVLPGQYKIALKSYRKKYLASERDLTVNAKRDEKDFGTTFTIQYFDSNIVALKSAYNKYVAAEGQTLHANRDEITSWAKFKLEIVSSGSSLNSKKSSFSNSKKKLLLTSKKSKCDQININLSLLSNATSQLFNKKEHGTYNRMFSAVKFENYLGNLLHDTANYVKEMSSKNMIKNNILNLIRPMKKDLISLAKGNNKRSTKLTMDEIIQTINKLKSIANYC